MIFSMFSKTIHENNSQNKNQTDPKIEHNNYLIMHCLNPIFFLHNQIKNPGFEV